jgi:hypothetical protein
MCCQHPQNILCQMNQKIQSLAKKLGRTHLLYNETDSLVFLAINNVKILVNQCNKPFFMLIIYNFMRRPHFQKFYQFLASFLINLFKSKSRISSVAEIFMRPIL